MSGTGSSIHATPSVPWNRRPKNPIGYEMFEVSRVRVAQAGEISVLDIIRDRTEVSPETLYFQSATWVIESVFPQRNG